MKMTLICMSKKSHFHMKGWAPGLALRKRLKVIRKWPIGWQKTYKIQLAVIIFAVVFIRTLYNIFRVSFTKKKVQRYVQLSFI